MQKIRVIAVALAGSLLTSACAAGQIAATANEQATIDGVNRTIGHVALRALSLAAPTKAPSYPKGSSIAIDLVLINTGQEPDTLTNISTSIAGGWGTGKSGSTSVALPAGERVASNAGSSLHLVLTGTTKSIFPGNVYNVDFTFQNAGTIRVPVPVHLTVGGSGGMTVPAPSTAAGDDAGA